MYADIDWQPEHCGETSSQRPPRPSFPCCRGGEGGPTGWGWKTMLPFSAYLQAMPQPLEIPLKIAQAFVRDMRAFHAEENSIKREEIASRQLQKRCFCKCRITPDCKRESRHRAEDRWRLP